MQAMKKAVKSSPLNPRKHAGKYSLMGTEDKDPFVEGITFNCSYVGSTHVQHKFDHVDTRAAIKQIWGHSGGSKSLKRMTIRVRAESLRVKDIQSKMVVDELPIYRISYCGTTSDMPLMFFFIHRDKEDPKQLSAQIFKLESNEKVKACILTIQKAFNIAYKAWQAKKRQKEKTASRSSPLAAKKVPVGGSPQPPRKHEVLIQLQTDDMAIKERGRSNSDGTIEPLVHPGVAKIKESAVCTNELTGSTHELTLSDDYDEFDDLAASRSNPDLLDTSIEDAKPQVFKLADFKDQIDPGSVDDLLKI